MDVARHTIEVKVIVKNEQGKETAFSSIGLGEMKLDDIKAVEKVLLVEIPKLFLGMLK